MSRSENWYCLAVADEQVKIGDELFERAKKEQYTYLKIRMQERASFWYDNSFAGPNRIIKSESTRETQDVAAACGIGPNGGCNHAIKYRAKDSNLLSLVNLESMLFQESGSFQKGP